MPRQTPNGKAKKIGVSEEIRDPDSAKDVTVKLLERLLGLLPVSLADEGSKRTTILGLALDRIAGTTGGAIGLDFGDGGGDGGLGLHIVKLVIHGSFSLL